MTEVGSVTIYEDFKDRKTLTHSIFCIKIRSLADLTVSWSKNLIFSDKVLIAFKKAFVNFWGIILCLWLRINNPSKFCMTQLYIVNNISKSFNDASREASPYISMPAINSVDWIKPGQAIRARHPVL